MNHLLDYDLTTKLIVLSETIFCCTIIILCSSYDYESELYLNTIPMLMVYVFHIALHTSMLTSNIIEYEPIRTIRAV